MSRSCLMHISALRRPAPQSTATPLQFQIFARVTCRLDMRLEQAHGCKVFIQIVLGRVAHTIHHRCILINFSCYYLPDRTYGFKYYTVHGGVVDVRGRPDFSRFDPRPGRPHFSNFGPPTERRPFCKNSPKQRNTGVYLAFFQVYPGITRVRTLV